MTRSIDCIEVHKVCFEFLSCTNILHVQELYWGALTFVTPCRGVA